MLSNTASDTLAALVFHLVKVPIKLGWQARQVAAQLFPDPQQVCLSGRFPRALPGNPLSRHKLHSCPDAGTGGSNLGRLQQNQVFNSYVSSQGIKHISRSRIEDSAMVGIVILKIEALAHHPKGILLSTPPFSL